MSYFPYTYGQSYQHPYNAYTSPHSYERTSVYTRYPYPVKDNTGHYNSFFIDGYRNMRLTDYGPHPFVIDINQATRQNQTFRTALWTGEHLQLTLMSIGVGEDIGLEMHPNVDQFLRVEQGFGVVEMGSSKNTMDFRRTIQYDFAIIIPAGTWHNIINIGNSPLRLYSIYAPPNHPFNTVHLTKQVAMEKEHHHSHHNGAIFDKTPDEWIMHTQFLVEEGLEDYKKGINMTHILQELILMGVLVGKGFSPEKAYETVEEWERTGESKLLQQSKQM